ncbi:MAG: hypothetical protein ACI82Z_000053 [Cellvibrionaceae bacterium]
MDLPQNVSRLVYEFGKSNKVYSPKVFREYVNFEVTKNKVNYLGRLAFYFEIADQNNLSYTSEVINKEGEDISRLLETWPQLENQIQTQLFEIGQIKSTN